MGKIISLPAGLCRALLRVALLVALPVLGHAQLTLTVTTTADAGPGSLRQALDDANAIAPGPVVTLAFAIPGPGPHVIQPVTLLPTVARSDVTIDGYTQPGAAPNMLALGRNNAVLKIVIDGAIGYGACLGIGDRNRLTIRGLSFVNCNLAIAVNAGGGGNDTGLVFTGNWFGFAPDGTIQRVIHGIDLFNGSARIGGADPGDMNLFAAQNNAISGERRAGSLIDGNLFGVFPDGSLVAPGTGTFSSSYGVIAFSRDASPDVPVFQVGDPAGVGNHFAGMSREVVFGVSTTTLSRNIIRNPVWPTLAYPNDIAEPSPAITALTFGAGTTTIQGTYPASTTTEDYRLEFFSSELPDVSAYGAADAFLGSISAAVDANTSGSFSFTAPGDRPNVSANKTRLGGNTSLVTRAIGPKLAASPNPAVFTTTAGTPTSGTITITNGGAGFVTFGTFTATGAGIGIGTDTCSGQTVTGGGTCTIVATFSPVAAGPASGKLSASIAAAAPPVTLGGTAITYEIAVNGTANPATYSLAVTPLGTGSGLVAGNANPSPAINCQRLAGVNSGTCQASYAPGSMVTLTALPGAGSSFAFWTGDCSGSAATCTVMLDAARNVGAAFVSGSLLSGTPVAMTVNAPDAVTIGTPLTVTAALVATPPGAIDGTVTFFNGLGALCASVQPVVANAASCTVTPMTTAPLAVWATYSGSATYQPAQSTPKAVDVLGGNGATLSMDFGAVTLGTTSETRTALVGNTTGSPLLVTQIATTGDFASTHACPSSLAAGATCPVTLTFSPTASGARSGVLTATTSPAGATGQIALSGLGVAPGLAPQLVVSPLSLPFGTADVGFAGSTQTVTVTNTGATAAQGLAVAADAPLFGIANGCGTTLAAGASCLVAVRFEPRDAGAASATLAITAANVAGGANVSLSGTGRTPAPVKLSAQSPTVYTSAGVATPLRVKAYRDTEACTRDNGTTTAGRCPQNCSITDACPQGAGTCFPTTTVTSGACPAGCGFGGRSCATITVGTDTTMQSPIGNVRLDWAATGACSLASPSTLTGADGIADVNATDSQPTTCMVTATTRASPPTNTTELGCFLSPSTCQREKATILLDASGAQAAAAQVLCEGDSTRTADFDYSVPQASGTFSGAFLVQNGQGGPIANARITTSGLGGATLTTDASGRGTFSFPVATRASADYPIGGSVGGTSLSTTCRVRVTQSPASLIVANGTELPEHVVNSAGQFVGSRSGRFCATLLDQAGDPYRKSDETISFGGPADTPTVTFANGASQADGKTDANGVACSSTAVLALKSPAQGYDFEVKATYARPGPDPFVKYRLTRATANQGDVRIGSKTMSSLNAIQSGVAGTPYPQDLCVVITAEQPTVYPCQSASGQLSTCVRSVQRGVANEPVTFEVLTPNSGPSVLLRAPGTSGAGTTRVDTATAAAAFVPVLAGVGNNISSGRACVSALANASTGVAYVKATSSGVSLLFTLTNVTAQPSAVSIGASSLSVPLISTGGQPITIQVKNTAGVPVASATVNFAVAYDTLPSVLGTAAPSVSPVSVLTDSRGFATTQVRANGYPLPFRVVATTLLPAIAGATSGRIGASVENGIFEVSYLVMPMPMPDPALDPDGDADGDGIPNGVELAQGTYALDKDNDVFGDAQLFAMQQYRDFLSREGEADGIGFWAAQVGSGTLSRDRVIESFFNSTEFQGTISPVVRLYFAYFLRVPDYGGLEFWIGQYKAGVPLATVSQAFASSQEFAMRYGALDNGQFVTLVYENVLGRAPDAQGFAYWTGQLNSGAFNRGQVMLGFSESSEYRAAINNEVFVTMSYVGMLRRAPDPSGFSFWVGYMDAGNSGLALLNGFLGAPEYRNRFLP